MLNQSIQRFLASSPVVANLIIVNLILLLATWGLQPVLHIDLMRYLALYMVGSDLFRPHQFFTHMFMHAGFTHLFFNMFALWMFGRILEQVWGSKRFLFYYLFTGLGAAAIHSLVVYFEFSVIKQAAEELLTNFTPESFSTFVNAHFSAYYSSVSQQGLAAWFAQPTNPVLIDQNTNLLHELLSIKANIPTVGASGAVYGLLLAFGLLFPNATIYLLIPPIPIKAKWFVIIYAAIELYLGFSQPGSNVAHFAHLGGMLFGFILIRYWKKHASRL